MATRTAKLYQGEDFAPIIDYTDLVIWEESEFGTRAWRGEGSASTVVIRDPSGEQGNSANLPAGLSAKSLASKNLFVIALDTDYLFRGRVGIKNYSRDDQRVERYRQVECELHDTNWDLDHIFVHGWVRGAETDNARVQGLIAAYLSGSPRPTTALNGSNFLSGSNTVSLAAQDYNRSSPLQVLRDIATTVNKQFFVTGDAIGGGSLFWDGNDSTVYQSGLRISDRSTEINTTGTCSGGSPSVVRSAYDFGSQPAIRVESTDPADRVLYGAMLVSNDTDTTMTWRPDGSQSAAGAQAMTQIAVVTHPAPENGTNEDGNRLVLFRLINPTPSTHATSYVASTFTGQLFGHASAAILVSGASQTAPEEAIGTNSGTGSSSSVTVPASASSLVIDFVGWRVWTGSSLAAPVPSADQTQLFAAFFDNAFGQNDMGWGASRGDATPAWTLGASRNWVAGAIAVAGSSAALTFPPIWDVGPASTEDGAEQLCEVVLFYGTGATQYVTTHDLTVHTQYGHASATFTDDADISAATALTRARSILAHRKYEDKTYNVTIGPLTDAQVLCVKHGQTIQIKARAIPDADDQFRTMRIVQCRFTTPIAGTWFAHLQLGRPWKIEPYGTGPTLVPGSGAATNTTPAAVSATASAGTDNGELAAADHAHAHGNIIVGGPYHEAADVTFAPTGTIAATNVQTAIAEVASEGLTATITAPVLGDRLRYNGTAWVNDRKRWVPVTTDPLNNGNWVLVFADNGDVMMSEVED